MAKEKEKIGLRPVDEQAERISRYHRLHPDAVEEVVELPPVRVGGKSMPEPNHLMEPEREDLKMRPKEPDIGSLIERDEVIAEAHWETPSVPSRGFPWGWLVLLGVIFAAGLIWSLVEVNRAKERQSRLVEEAKKITEKNIEDGMDAEAVIRAIDVTVRNFFDSRSVGELSRYVRQPERVAPLMGIHYRDKAPVPRRVVRVVSLDPLTIQDRAAFWMVSCELEDGATAQVLAEVISPNEVKVDWETFTCYQPMDWDEFARSRPAGYTGDFRVYVEPDNYYSHDFTDSDVFSSFRLTALKAEEIQYGYAARNTEVEKKMMESIKQNGGGATPMILRLHLPEGLLSKRGLVVKDMISSNWLILDNPDWEKQ
jgi:hypothetical protein